MLRTGSMLKQSRLWPLWTPEFNTFHLRRNERSGSFSSCADGVEVGDASCCLRYRPNDACFQPAGIWESKMLTMTKRECLETSKIDQRSSSS